MKLMASKAFKIWVPPCVNDKMESTVLGCAFVIYLLHIGSVDPIALFKSAISNSMVLGVESLTNLCDVDVSQNELPAVPEALYKLEGLKRLNLADNNIRELSNGGVEMWAKLETLNLSRNQLKVLPQVTKLSSGSVSF